MRIRSFSRRSLSSGNAGFCKTSIQIFRPSSRCRAWIERLLDPTVPARYSIRSSICSPVIVVVPPVRMMLAVRAWTPSLSGGSRKALTLPPPPPPPRPPKPPPPAAERHRRQDGRLDPGDLVVLGDVNHHAVGEGGAVVGRAGRLEGEGRELELLGSRSLLGHRGRGLRGRRGHGRRLLRGGRLLGGGDGQEGEARREDQRGGQDALQHGVSFPPGARATSRAPARR